MAKANQMNPPRHARLDDPDDTNQSHCGFFAVAVGGRKHKGPLSRLGERGKESRKLKWVRSGQLQPCRGKGSVGGTAHRPRLFKNGPGGSALKKAERRRSTVTAKAGCLALRICIPAGILLADW